MVKDKPSSPRRQNTWMHSVRRKDAFRGIEYSEAVVFYQPSRKAASRHRHFYGGPVSESTELAKSLQLLMTATTTFG